MSLIGQSSVSDTTDTHNIRSTRSTLTSSNQSNLGVSAQNYSQISSSSQTDETPSSTQSSTTDSQFQPPSESPELDYVLLPIQRTSCSEKYCIVCGALDNRLRVPFEARLHCYSKMKIFIPNGARICREHLLNSRFYQDDLDKIKVCSQSSRISVNEVTRLIEGLKIESNKSLLNQAADFELSDDRFKTLTGLTIENFKVLRSMIKSSKDSVNRTVNESLIIFLFKLRTGSSNRNISTIFKLKNDQLVSACVDSIIDSFEKDILPENFGVKRYKTDEEREVARKELIEKHTSGNARKLLKSEPNQLALIFDGTYLKHQKSSNNEYQRKAFSGQKKVPLAKPFTICTTNGLQVDSCGPFEGTKNDAEITKKVLADPKSVFSLMRPGDIIIVDRGFRDVKNILEEKGFKVMMPALKLKRKQLPTKEANESRIVTKLRWVIEALHGQMKQKYKLFHHMLDNKLLPKVKLLYRIACYLNNTFGKRFKTDSTISNEIIDRMLNPVYSTNTLANIVENENWHRKSKLFEKLKATDLADFPEITERDLKILFSGTYQLAMAISYLAEMLDEQGDLQLKYIKNKNIVAVSVQSRHSNRKVYKCYIEYKPNTDGIGGIKRYTCDCPNGLRTIGCCCHVASIIYYLSNARYHSRILKPAEKLTTLFREEEIELETVDEYELVESQNSMDQSDQESEQNIADESEEVLIDDEDVDSD